MPFYYLHDDQTEAPQNEYGFKYLIYSEYEINDPHIGIPGNYIEKIYCCHPAQVNIKHWSVDDDIVYIVGQQNQIRLTFKKIEDAETRGFTMWQNQDFIPSAVKRSTEG